jgi:VanZ family protein
VVYIPLVVFIWLDKGLSPFRNPYKTLGWVIVLLFFAIVTEWVQYILPYRAFNINDLIANCLGVLLGVFFMMLISFRPARVIK